MLGRIRWPLGLLWLVATTAAVLAQDCTLPGPFQHQFASDATASLSAPNAGDPCALSVALNAGGGPAAAGFLHYRRPAATTSVRYGFRLDTSTLTDYVTANRRVQLFAASSAVVSGVEYPWSNILQIALVGGASPTLRFLAARGGVSPVLVDIVPLTQTLNSVRFEINVGIGAAGSVRYWLNHTFADPPDGVIDAGGAGLDNAAWAGVIGAEVGLSSPSEAFLANHAGSAIVFDQIESSDDLLFWDDFTFGVQ